MDANTVTPIIIKVKLRESQYLSFNKWSCTIHGEQRVVLLQWVEWYCMNVEDAIHSFKESEISEFTITGKYHSEPVIFRGKE